MENLAIMGMNTMDQADNMQKAFITSKGVAKFACPKCQKFKIVDVTNYTHLDRQIMVNAKCPCGNEFRTLLEKRAQYRKKTNLLGIFRHRVEGKELSYGLMTVCDLSKNGAKLKINDEYQFSIDDRLQIEFHLNDNIRSLIKKKVIIRNISFPFLCTEFSPTEGINKALGFYLFN